jgi:sigma-E factor negative regulatory protein RseC
VIVESATVLELDGDAAIVRCHRQAACQRCAEGRGCGGGIMSRLLGDRLRTVRVALDGRTLQPGDEVTIGLDENGLVRASAAMYFIPLLGALALAFAATAVFGRGDAIEVAGAIGGFWGGLVWARRFGRSREGDERYRPRILGRSAAGVDAAIPTSALVRR